MNFLHAGLPLPRADRPLLRAWEGRGGRGGGGGGEGEGRGRGRGRGRGGGGEGGEGGEGGGGVLISIDMLTCPDNEYSDYYIAGKFGGEFNLAVWQSPTAPSNLISTKFLDSRIVWIAYPHARIT